MLKLPHKKFTDSDRVYETICEASGAVTFEEIYSIVTDNRYLPRQRVRNLLLDLEKNKLIKKEIYTLELSADPKISVVVTEIFYETKIQKQKYEKEFLPDLMKEARENLK